MKSNLVIPKFIRFLIVGIANTAIDLGLLNILIAVFGLAQPFLFSLYKGVSFFCALLNSYYLNKNFTFKFRENRKRTFPLFILFSLTAFLVNVISASLLFHLLSSGQFSASPHLVATASGLFGAILGLFVNYSSYNYLVFK